MLFRRWVVAVCCALLMSACGDDDGASGTSGGGFGGTGAIGGIGGSGAVGGVGGAGAIGGIGGSGAVGGVGGTGAIGGVGGAGAIGGVGGGGTGGGTDAGADAATLVPDAAIADAHVDATTAGTGGVGGTGGTGGTGGVGGSNRVAAAGVCERLAELQCAAEANCCTNASRRYASIQACVSNQRSVCDTNFRAGEIGSNAAAGYSIDQAEIVFDQFQQLTGACDPDVASWGVSSSGFLTMFRGTRALDASCQPTSLNDVGTAFSCRIADGLTCVPTMAGFPGLPPTGWTCKPFSPSGGRCYTDVNCQDNLRCAAPETFSTCTARKANGAVCSAPHECLSLLCENNLCVAPNVEDAYCLGG